MKFAFSPTRSLQFVLFFHLRIAASALQRCLLFTDLAICGSELWHGQTQMRHVHSIGLRFN